MLISMCLHIMNAWLPTKMLFCNDVSHSHNKSGITGKLGWIIKIKEEWEAILLHIEEQVWTCNIWCTDSMYIKGIFFTE